MRRKQPQGLSVTVSWTARNGETKEKTFSDIYKARRFFTAKDKAGMSPSIKSNLGVSE